MIQSLFILSPTGEVLIERHFRGVTTSRGVCDTFWFEAARSVNHHGGVSSASSLLQHSPGLMNSFYDTVLPVMEIPASYGGNGKNNSGNGDRDDRKHGGGGGGTLYVVSALRDGLSYLAVCPAEVSPLLVLEFLHRIASTFVEYFGPPADESTIKDNFSTVYQLLEEMVDYGWPLTTEINSLKQMIRPPTVMSRLLQSSTTQVSDELPSGTVSNMPWRASNVHYTQNEIYIDIIEEVDAIITAAGKLVSCDISGNIQCQSHLSGFPDLLLTFKDPALIDDCSFHPCVRYTRYEKERIVSFVPPDGDFELMRYRIKPQVVSNFGAPPIYCHAQVTYLDPTTNNNPPQAGKTSTSSSVGSSSAGDTTTTTKTGRIVLQVGVTTFSSLILSATAKKGPLQIEEVAITIPLPKQTKQTRDFATNYGHVFYDEATKVAKWTLGTIDPSKKASLSCTFIVSTSTGKKKATSRKGHDAMSGSDKKPYGGVYGSGGSGSSAYASSAVYHNYGGDDYELYDEDDEDDDTFLTAPPNLSLHWKIPLASVSGLSVSGLSITRENYRPYKGVRNITKSGLFQVRCSS